jgi:site-specific DNA recombinase
MTKHYDLIKTFAKGSDEASTKKKVKSLKAVIYTRVSSKEQMDNLSLETQLKGCSEFAKRYSYELCGQFGGTYESAMSDERKEFVRMINFVKKAKEKIAYIIVYSLERFSRTGDNAIWLSRQLRELGVTIVSVTQPIDTSNPSGVLQQNILFLFSQYDNDLRKQKCVAGMKEKLLRGEWMGVLPLGYSFDRTHGTREQKIVKNDDAALIHKAFIMKLNGATHQEISDAIAAKGLKLTVKRLAVTLRNPFYCGYISHNMLEGELVKGKHPTLVSEDIFLQVNDVLTKNAQGYKHTDRSEYLPLKQFIRCGKCEAPMTGYLRKKKLKSGRILEFHYYKCYTRGCRCNKSNKILHDKFVNLLKRYELNRNLVPLVKKQLHITWENLNQAVANENKSIIAKLSDLKGKLDKVEERFAFGEIDRPIYDKASIKLKAEIEEITKELAKSDLNISNPLSLLDKWADFAANLHNLWVSGDAEERKMVQDILFPEGIYFDQNLDHFRTSRANEVLGLITSLSEEYEQKKERQEDDNLNLSPSVARGGVEPPTFGL